MVYGIVYGMGSKALSNALSVNEEVAEQLMDDFKSYFSGRYCCIIRGAGATADSHGILVT